MRDLASIDSQLLTTVSGGQDNLVADTVCPAFGKLSPGAETACRAVLNPPVRELQLPQLPKLPDFSRIKVPWA